MTAHDLFAELERTIRAAPPEDLPALAGRLREAELLASLIIERASAGPEGTNTDARSLRLLRMLGAGDEVRPEG